MVQSIHLNSDLTCYIWTPACMHVAWCNFTTCYFAQPPSRSMSHHHKTPSCYSFRVTSTPSPTPGNHWSILHLYSYVISWMIHKGNHQHISFWAWIFFFPTHNFLAVHLNWFSVSIDHSSSLLSIIPQDRYITVCPSFEEHLGTF